MQEVIIFDSGVGGLSILRTVKSLNLGYPLTYLADQANFPYGDKSEGWLSSRLRSVAVWVSQIDPVALVIACNTATVSAISEVRRVVTCPVVGVEPVTKPLGEYQRPLLLATKATLSTLVNPPLAICPTGLVRAIEDLDQAGIAESLSALKPVIVANHVDALGLSCTHYPLVIDQIRELYPALPIIDPSQAVAKRLGDLLAPSTSPVSEISYLTTADPTILASQVQYYLGSQVTASKVTI